MVYSTYLNVALNSMELNVLLAAEQDARLKNSPTFANALQAYHSYCASELISQALQSASFAPLTGRATALICLLPLINNCFLSKRTADEQHSAVDHITQIIYHNWSHINLAATLISAAALTYLGHHQASGLSLFILSTGMLSRMGLLPTLPTLPAPAQRAISWLNQSCFHYIVLKPFLTSLSLVNVSIVLLYLLPWIAPNLPNLEKTDCELNMNPQITEEIYRQIKNDELKLEINQDYVFKHVMPPIPDYELKELLTNCPEEDKEQLSALIQAAEVDRNPLMRDYLKIIIGQLANVASEKKLQSFLDSLKREVLQTDLISSISSKSFFLA